MSKLICSFPSQHFALRTFRVTRGSRKLLPPPRYVAATWDELHYVARRALRYKIRSTRRACHSVDKLHCDAKKQTIGRRRPKRDTLLVVTTSSRVARFSLFFHSGALELNLYQSR